MSLASPVEQPEQLRRSRAYWIFADALVVAKRDVIKLFRIPELLIYAIASPIMFVVLFRFVFGGAIDVGGDSYINFLMAGIFVQTVAFGAIGTGAGIAEDMGKGVIDRFRSLPMSPSAVIAGRTLADVLRNMVSIVVMIVVGLAVGFRPTAGVTDWLAALGLLVLFSYAMSWAMARMGLSMKSAEAANNGSFFWIMPLTFVSSAFVQVDSMPGWLQTFAEYQPLTLVIDAVRGFLIGTPAGNDAWYALAWLAAVLIIFIPWSVHKYGQTTVR